MSGRWTKAQRAKYEATLAAKRNGAKRVELDPALVHTLLNAIRALPDSEFIWYLRKGA